MPALQRWVPEVLPLLLLLLLAGGVQPRQQGQQGPQWLQTGDGADGQLWPAVVAVTRLAFSAGCRLPAEHVVCHQLLPARGLVGVRWVVGSASAAQTAAAAWRTLLLLLMHFLSPHWAQAVAIGLQFNKTPSEAHH